MRAIDYFEKGAEAFAERCAIVDGATRCSYRELREATQHIAQALWASGLRTEDRVAIYSPNDWRVLACMLALLRARAVWVPINYRNAVDANVEYLNYVETSVLFYHSKFAGTVEDIRKRVPSLTNLVCIDMARGGDPSLEEFM